MWVVMVSAADHASRFSVGVPERQHVRFFKVRHDVFSHHFSIHSNAVVCVLPRFNFFMGCFILYFDYFKKIFKINHKENKGRGQ